MSPILERLPILVLYPHSRCNCRCVMCDIWKESKAREITVEELERHAGDIGALGVEWVVLSGGEPLMHSDLFRLCRMLRAMGIRITLLSSGLLLKRNARAIVEHVDEVIVSLDGPEAVHDAIRGVIGAFRALGEGVRALDQLPVDARVTVQRGNHNRLVETVDAAQKLGLRTISFLAADLTSDAFNRPNGWPPEHTARVALDASELSALESEIDRLIGHRPLGFIREAPEKLRRIAAHFRGAAVAPRCNAPWVSAVIESDGTVRPCFFHAPIGRLEGRALIDVINSPQAIQFRRDLIIGENPVCMRCVCSLFRSEMTSGAEPPSTAS